MPKVEPARTLHFDSLEALLADARAIADHPSPRTRGSWSASQNIWHVARYLQASVEGYPFQVPLLFKLIGPLMKKRMITKTMSAGYNAPKQVGKAMEPQNIDPALTAMEPALALLETWIAKANDQGFIPRNPAFGTMDRQQWVDLHCRHAELHFGLVELP